jgi:transcriptional regulator with XRE-family HTH domain
MSKINKELGSLVRKHRIKDDMTQLELANKLGYESMQFVSLFERGVSKIPLTVLGKLIVILGMSEKQITKIILDDYKNNVIKKILDGQHNIMEAELKL